MADARLESHARDADDQFGDGGWGDFHHSLARGDGGDEGVFGGEEDAVLLQSAMAVGGGEESVAWADHGGVSRFIFEEAPGCVDYDGGVCGGDAEYSLEVMIDSPRMDTNVR